MDVSQANENELQKAIDDITSGATAAQGDTNTDVAAELEAKIQNQMGTPPAPVMPDSGAVPEMAMPPMPTNSVDAMNPETPAPETPAIIGSGAPVVVDGNATEPETVPVTVGSAEATEASPAPAAEEATSEATPAVAPVVEGELDSVKQAMLRDLFPLMDKVELAPEQKYDIYKEMIDSTDDKNMIPAAYEAVKGITDDTAKAEALLYLVNKAE